MDNNTVSTRMQGLLALYDMQTDFLSRALDGISEADMQNRLGTQANHMAWLAGALVTQRFQMASEMKHDVKQTKAEMFAGNQGIKEGTQYPTAAEYIKDWNAITPHARKALQEITDAKLDSKFEMEGMEMTWYEMVTFTMYREASIIGQLALWRRLLGYPAMKYD